MKFNLQDEQNPIHHSQSSSNHSFFTEQTIPAGCDQKETSGGRDDEVKAEMRETILWKLEKERIREAIIAEEVARRRLLEAEVRKELLMEHEIAIRSGGRLTSPFMMHPSPSSPPVVGLGLEERLIMSINQKYGIGSHHHLLADSPQIEDKHGVTVLLEHSGETLSAGKKRKSAPPPAAAASEASSQQRSNKKVKEEWECSICEVSATSEVNFNQHLQGRRHRVKEANFLAQKTGANVGLGVTVPKKPINQTSSGEEKSEPEKKPVDLQALVLNKTSSASDSNGAKKKKKDDYLFWCEMCEVGASFEVVMNDHKQGKKHLARLQLYRKSKVDCEGSSTEKSCDIIAKAEE